MCLWYDHYENSPSVNTNNVIVNVFIKYFCVYTCGFTFNRTQLMERIEKLDEYIRFVFY